MTNASGFVTRRADDVQRGLGASWSVHAFGHGGGNFGDITAAWESRIEPTTVLTLGSSLSAAGDRCMQTYCGISPEQAARSRYSAYEPSAGLRDMALFANLRHDIGNDWIVLTGASLTRVLGPAAESPLTARKTGFGLSAGLARRF